MTISTVASSTRGELSWQQAGRLQRDVERGERITNPTGLVALPDSLTTAYLRDRLSEIVRREEVLRITELSYDGDEYAIYSPDIALPLRTKTVGSAADLDAIAAGMASHPFARDGGPLWELAVVDHPDESGTRTRSVCVVFDHLITDGRSRQLFLDELLGLRCGGASRELGKYRDWVTWQRRQYPRKASEMKTEAREFWLRYLDSKAPDRASALPFCVDPGGPLSGVVYALRNELPTSIVELRAAAGSLKSSPFILFLASVASAIGAVSGETDITLRVNTTARRSGFLDTLGYFADSVPIRIQSGSLGDPRQALRATTVAWLPVLEYQTTPWDYILAVCAQSDSPSTVHRPAQVLVNFIPWVMHGRRTLQPPFRQYRSQLGAFQLIMTVAGDEKCHLHCQFDPGRFAQAEVRGFLDVLGQRLAQLSAAD